MYVVLILLTGMYGMWYNKYIGSSLKTSWEKKKK